MARQRRLFGRDFPRQGASVSESGEASRKSAQINIKFQLTVEPILHFHAVWISQCRRLID
jgi:hypothetical protein